jgi:hypothetical protein
VSITATASSASFDGNDVATDFPLPFRFLEDNDLLVQLTDDGGVTYTTLVLDDDYTLDGAGPDDGTGTEEGGTLTLTGGALATGSSLVVTRTTDQTQSKTFQPQGDFSPIQYSRMVDKLTLIVQELTRRLAVLESLGELVNVTDLADGVDVNAELETLDPIEDSFPFVIAVAGGNAAKQALFRLEDIDDDEDFNSEAFAVNWLPGPGANEITVRFITGLKPSNFYTVHARVLF